MMDTSELQPIVRFLSQLSPFDGLPVAMLEYGCRALKVGYYSKKSAYVPIDEKHPQLYIVRSGAFEVRTEDGALIDRLGEGDFFGFPSLLSGEKVSNRVKILEDGLIYHLDPQTFNHLRGGNREFDRFFYRAFTQRLRHQGRYAAKDLTSTSRVATLMAKRPLTLDINARVATAARLMGDARVSSILVVENQKLVGILTDKDLRNRVLAKGLDGRITLRQAMSASPITLTSNALIFEAMLLMSQHNIHHLPILEQEGIVGVISSTDILRRQSSQPLLLIGEIERQNDMEGLVAVGKRIPLLLQNLIGAGARADEIGQVLTSVTDVLTRRLIVLNQQILGDAPLPFCWLAFGSQARQDQAACSDQDNGLLYQGELDTQAKDYFDALTKAVCTGLDRCGYCYCPGQIMAQNPRWRMSLEQWHKKFETWVLSPDPKALLHASIFFDMRCISGASSLFDSLQDKVLSFTKKNDIFLAAMATNALQVSPPLGFFKQFVLDRDGQEVKGIDLKHRGNALINDIVRIYALSAGIKEVNTAKRIRSLMEQRLINRKDALNLADAHEFIAHMRLSNQGYQHTHNQPLTNFLKPQQLSSLLRHQLRDAFKVVHDAQVGLKLKFTRSF